MNSEFEAELNAQTKILSDMIIALQQIVALMGRTVFTELPEAKKSYLIQVLKIHEGMKQEGHDSVAEWFYKFGAGPLE